MDMDSEDADADADASGEFGAGADGTVGVGLVVATFNREVTEQMEERARAAVADREATLVETLYVPGAYDTPLAADRLARRPDVDAVVAVGAIVAGDTDHDRVIGRAATRGLTDVSLDRDVPITLGITGPGQSAAEARERIDYAADAVDGAVEMARGI